MNGDLYLLLMIPVGIIGICITIWGKGKKNKRRKKSEPEQVAASFNLSAAIRASIMDGVGSPEEILSKAMASNQNNQGILKRPGHLGETNDQEEADEPDHGLGTMSTSDEWFNKNWPWLDQGFLWPWIGVQSGTMSLPCSPQIGPGEPDWC